MIDSGNSGPTSDYNKMQPGQSNKQLGRILIMQPTTNHYPQSVRQEDSNLDNKRFNSTHHQQLQNQQLADKIHQLRSEHQILKAVAVDSIKESEPFNQSSSGMHSTLKKYHDRSRKSDNSSKLNSSASAASISSKKVRGAFSKQQNQQYHLQQNRMQYMVQNCLKKLQLSLKNEIELKKTIHDLEMQISSQPSQHKISNNYGFEEEKQALRQQLQHQRALNREFVGRVGKLQGEKAVNVVQIQKLRKSNEELQTQILDEKRKWQDANLDSNKKVMEVEIQRKRDQYEISRLNSMLNQSKTRKQQPEISSQNQSQMILLRTKLADAEAQNRRLISETKGSALKQGEIIELFSKIDGKIAVNQKNDLMEELNQLKQSMLQVKKMKAQYPQNHYQFSFQSRIESLHKTMEQENLIKKQFEATIDSLQNQLDDAQRKYQILKLDSDAAEDELQRKIRRLQAELLEQKKHNNLQQSSQILKLKLQNFDSEGYANKYSNQQSEYKQDRANWKQLQQKLQNEINQLKTRVNDAEVHLNKSNLEKSLSMEMSNRLIESEKQGFHYAMQNIKSERDAWKSQYIELKKRNDVNWQQLESLKLEKNQVIRNLMMQKQENLREIRLAQQREIQSMRNQYLDEKKALMERIEAINQVSSTKTEIGHKHSLLQAELHEVKRILKKQMTVESNIFHLWGIKEVEYKNIHAIISQMGWALPQKSGLDSSQAEMHHYNVQDQLKLVHENNSAIKLWMTSPKSSHAAVSSRYSSRRIDSIREDQGQLTTH